MNYDQAEQLVNAVKLISYCVAFVTAVFTLLFLCGKTGGDE